MKTKKRPLIILIWWALTVGIRILYYWFTYSPIQDTFGFFDSAIIRLEEGEHLLSSGLGFAFTNVLADLAGIFGTDIGWVFYFQLILEIFALLFLFLGTMNFWGMRAALLSCSLLSISPVLLEQLRVCSPEEFYLFFFSGIFLIMSLFSSYTRHHQWTKSTKNEFIVLLMGAYIGILCAWNYLGVMLLLIMLLIVIRNYRILHDKSKLQGLVERGVIDEEKHIMTVFSQNFILLVGLAAGLFLTLLRYTGFSGLTLAQQFNWWLYLFSFLPAKTMDFDTWIAVYLVVSILLGILLAVFYNIRAKRRENAMLEAEEMVRPAVLASEQAFVHRDISVDTSDYVKDDGAITQVSDDDSVLKPFRYPDGIKPNVTNNENNENNDKEFFVAPDGRKVAYLENPLPVPKKHVPRGDMRFDLDEISISNKDIIVKKDDDEINYNKNEFKSEDGPSNHTSTQMSNPVPPVKSEPSKDDFDLDVLDGDDFDF